MELHIDRDPLLKALARVQTVVERRNTMPILGNALLEAQEGEGHFKISATNLEVSLRTICPATVQAPGTLTVNAKTLFEIVRELPEELVVLRKDGRNRLHLTCGRAKFELAGLPSNQFPAISEVDGDYRFTLETHVLAAMLSKTHFAMSFDENRFTLNGLFFQVTPAELTDGESALRIVATDTHRMAMTEHYLRGVPTEAKEVIIPKKAIQEMRRILEETPGDHPLEIILDNAHVQLITPEIILVSKLVEGRFPDYRQVIPQGNPLQLTVDREPLLGVVRRMSVLSHEKSRGIRLEIEGNRMQFHTNNPEQELAEEEMAVTLEGGTALTVGFNARYLKEFLMVMEGEQVLFSLKDDISPVLLITPGQTGTQFVLMPMHV